MTRYIVLVQQGPYTRTVHGPYKTFKEAEGDARAWQGTVEPIVEKGAPAPDPSPFPEGNQEKRLFTFTHPLPDGTPMELRGVDELVDKITAWWPFIIAHDNFLFQHGKTPIAAATHYKAELLKLQFAQARPRKASGTKPPEGEGS